MENLILVWFYWTSLRKIKKIGATMTVCNIIHMHHLSCDLLLLVEFVKYLPTRSGKRTLQNRDLVLLKISARISVSTRIVTRKVSLSFQTEKSQNLKPVTKNCV